MAVNKAYLEMLEMEDLLAVANHVNAIETLPENKKINTEGEKGKIAEQFRLAVNAIPGNDEEVAAVLNDQVIRIYEGLTKKDPQESKKKKEKKEKKEKAPKQEKKDSNREVIQAWLAEGLTEEQIFEKMREAYPDRTDEDVRALMVKYLKPASKKREITRGYEDCSKSKIYREWQAGNKDCVALHKFVDEAVKLTTIRKWVGRWNKGIGLPAIATRG